MLTDKEYFIIRLRGHVYLGKVDDYKKMTSGDISGHVISEGGDIDRVLINHRNIVSVDGINDRHTIFITKGGHAPANEAFYVLGEPFVWI